MFVRDRPANAPCLNAYPGCTLNNEKINVINTVAIFLSCDVEVSLTLTWTRSMLKLKQERARLSLLDFAAAGHELVLPCALQLRLPGMLVSGK
jgi:hypothetical protein